MLQTGEIIIIALLALVVLGPSRLPDIARKMGRWMVELRNAARDITRGLEEEVRDFKDAGREVREAGRELRAPMDEVKKPFTEIRDEMSGFGRGGREWKGPKPVSGPTPEDAMRDLEEMNRLGEEGRDDEDDDPLPGSAGTPPNASPRGETGNTSPDASQGEETRPPPVEEARPSSSDGDADEHRE